MEEILYSGFAALGIPADARAAERFVQYFRALSERNKVMNLTAITEAEDVARLHFLDSVALLEFLDLSGSRVIDVGTGAGFPGLPLKIAEPTIRLTLLDSLRKRVDFLSETCAALELEDVECLHARAEEAPGLREQFDFAVSRAVARLNVLCELCLPFVRPGGSFLALKGPDPREEMDEARRAVAELGGEFGETLRYGIPGTDIQHTVVVVKKTKSTPAKYPRRFAKIQKSPL